MNLANEINEFSVIREINKISREYYHDSRTVFDHVSYLKGCLGCLRQFFSNNAEFRDKYLFSALTLKRQDSEGIEVINVNEDTGYDFAKPVKTLFEPIITKLLQAINDKECISLTRTLLKNSTDGKVLFFTSKTDYDVPIKPYPGQEADAKVRFFRLSSMRSIGDDFEEFLQEHESRILKFRRNLVDDAESAEGLQEYTLRRIGTLLWYYKQLELALNASSPDKDFAVHFFRPSFIEFEHNILLSLGTSQLLKPHQIAFLGLLVYRIASQMAIERIKEVEMIESLSHISVSTHAIKTAINGLLSPPLNSLAQSTRFRNEWTVQVALKSRDKLLALTEIINLMSKLTAKQLNESELRSALTSSNLFSKHAQNYELTKKLNEILAVSKQDKNHTYVTACGAEIVLDENAFSYRDLFPTEVFYELLLLTVVENCIKHGYINIREDEVKLDIEYDRAAKTIEFSNKPKSQEQFMLDYKDSTGNLRLFFALFRKLHLGEIKIYSTHKFFFTLRSN